LSRSLLTVCHHDRCCQRLLLCHQPVTLDSGVLDEHTSTASGMNSVCHFVLESCRKCSKWNLQNEEDKLATPGGNEELLGMRDYLFDLTHVKAMTCDVESTQRKVPRFFHDFTTVMASLWHGMSDILVMIHDIGHFGSWSHSGGRCCCAWVKVSCLSGRASWSGSPVLIRIVGFISDGIYVSHEDHVCDNMIERNVM
jgi:hypothetical protein